MERVFPAHSIAPASHPRALTSGPLLTLPSLPAYMQQEHLAGVLVLQAGQVRFERYALGLSARGRWTTFSVTKSFTDTLVGVALQAGEIHSLEEDVTHYLPELRGSAYEGVTIRQLLTMTSGVRWNENYTSPTADNVLLYSTPVATGLDPTVEYMRRLPREAAPGTRWHYNTGETDLLGVLLRRAAGKTLSQQLGGSLWQSAGMQRLATWIASAPGSQSAEFGGSGLSATVRDLGRFGLWFMEGGHGLLPRDWVAEASHAQVSAGAAGYGYGWWPQGSAGTYAALGIFGQSIFIDPARKLVIVTVGNWPEATGAAHTAARAAFWHEVQAAVDAGDS